MALDRGYSMTYNLYSVTFIWKTIRDGVEIQSAFGSMTCYVRAVDYIGVVSVMNALAIKQSEEVKSANRVYFGDAPIAVEILKIEKVNTPIYDASDFGDSQQ